MLLDPSGSSFKENERTITNGTMTC
jgi:hypothetical protein